MSRILSRFHSNTEVDIIWKICSITGLSICGVTIFIFIRTVQHLHCIPQSSCDTKFEPSNIKTYSTICITFALLSVLVNLSAYPVSTQWSYWNTDLMWVYNITFWSFYTLTKFFLYLIFIARLFNPYFSRIYQYPKYIKYCLQMLLFLLVFSLIEFIICLSFKLIKEEYPQYINNLCGLIYGLANTLLSISLLILYIRPLCSQRVKNTESFRIYMSLLMKYGIISTLQLISDVLFQCAFMVNMYLSHIDISETGWKEYNYISNVIQIADCMLLMICIYIGFSRKRTVCLWITTSND